MDPFFGPPEGRIFGCFPGAEDRPGQRRMAERVFDHIQESAGRIQAWKASGGDPESRPEALILPIEAGTGTGKSLGYLVPALAAGQFPVMVATRTKNLQRQLLENDLPRAQGILGTEFRAVVAKGRSNYLCRAAWEQLRDHPVELDRQDYELWQALPRWAEETTTGDREEILRYGEGESELWDRVNARAERCTGRQCPRFEDCFLTSLKQQLAEAQLVIVNHALLMADRVLRQSDFGQVLPDTPVLVLDEAHEIEEQVTDSCAESWSNRAMSLLLADLDSAAAADPGGGALAALCPPWRDSWEALVALVPGEGGTYGLEDARVPFQALADAVGNWVERGQPVWAEARRLGSQEKEGEAPRLWPRLAQRVGLAFDRMERVFAQPEGWVSTLTREGPRSVLFKSNPVAVQELFHEHIRRGFESVLLTSATLRDGRGFNGLRLRLGLTETEAGRAEVVESPFEFEAQGLLFVPPDLPERRAGPQGVGSPDWQEASLRAMERLLGASGGRALLLFTSRKMLHAFKPRLESALPDLTFFAQGGHLSRRQLLERFRTTPRAALLGLASFWQGVDLPGEALTLVIVASLPFAPPDDPVLQARVRKAEEERPGLGFIGIQVPLMTLKLKQGIGRLIRTRRDRGVVAILDPRLLLPHEDPAGKRYAAQVRAALPPFPLTRDWEAVESFLGRI
ncbi:MAG: ATP-dependent DNA helicase [Acidobacteria bacterium]|nr:ATP-dependent DNA helicase [Acidobacteriota bacterium]